MTDMKDAAKDYAARGWPVIPVQPGGKEGRKFAQHSKLRWNATTDPEAIERHWDSRPQDNLGIVCGPESGLLVIDADTVQGHGVDGVGNLEALSQEHGPLPETIQAISPSGSVHYYFRYPSDRRIGNSAGQVAPGVDVRGDGGMIVAPPSVRADGAYRWVRSPGEFGPAEPPEWVLKRLEKAIPKTPEPQKLLRPATEDAWAQKALHGELAILLAAREGQRNDALNTAAFNLAQIVAGGHLDEALVRGRLVAAGISIALTSDETAATIDSGFKAGLQQPRGPKREVLEATEQRLACVARVYAQHASNMERELMAAAHLLALPRGRRNALCREILSCGG